MSRDEALKRSEIRVTSANARFAELAASAGTSLAERPLDAGSFSVAAGQVDLAGTVRFALALDANGQALGRGGRAEFAADAIAVGPVAGAEAGTTSDAVLQLDVATLNALGAQTVVLGATSGASGANGTALNVRADSVSINTEGQTLSVPDLVVAARNVLQVEDGSRLIATALPGTAAGAVAPVDFTVTGNGAALRLSAVAGADVRRTGAVGTAGDLQVGAGSSLQAAGGSLLLDSTGLTQVGASAELQASQIGLASRVIAVGGAASTTELVLTPELSAQVSGADELSLRAYSAINFKDGARLGENAAGRPTLERLVLDTPRPARRRGHGQRRTCRCRRDHAAEHHRHPRGPGHARRGSPERACVDGGGWQRPGAPGRRAPGRDRQPAGGPAGGHRAAAGG